MSISARPSRPTLSTLQKTLAAQRPNMSLLEKEVLAGTDSFVFDESNWVRCWYDPGHAVTSDCGHLTAYRAITADGTLIWYVVSHDKAPVFHTSTADPVAAMEEAQDTRERRRIVRSRWDEVEDIAHALRRGTKKFDILLEDAKASPLCMLSIESFMKSFGLGSVTRISGRNAALLMMIEPRIGFVIFEAWRRQGQTACEAVPHTARPANT